MKFANIGLYLVALLVALFLSAVGIKLWGNVPFLSVMRFQDEEIKGVILIGVDFWSPIVNFVVYLVSLLLPAAIGLATCAYVERTLFTKPATMHVHVVLPLALLVAVALSALGFSRYVQYLYVFGVVLVYGLYSAFYQMSHALRGRKAARMQPAEA